MKWGKAVVALALAVASATLAPAYDLIKDESGIYVVAWDPGAIPTKVKLPMSPPLSDGTSQSGSVVAAMQAWNSRLGTVQFQWTELGGGVPDFEDDGNEISMSATIYEEAFDEDTLAVTLYYRGGNSRVEADIIFNTAWTWDSYRGPLSGHVPEDIRRVAIHELGHVLGLDHPDQASPPQSVNAIMNSRVSNVDTMQNDDIAGAQSLYGAPGFVPGNNDFANAYTINLSSGSTSVTGTNVAATAEPGEPALDADDPGRKTVWWKWTSPVNGNVTATTLGSNFDTLLGAYTGGSVNSLNQIALNDDVQSGVIRTSTVNFTAIAGATYFFAVDGWGGYAGSITVNLALTGVSPTITLNPSSRTVNINETATFSFGATGTPQPEYQWERLPAGSGTWQALVNGGAYSGVTGSTLFVTATTAMHGDQFRGVARNFVGWQTSATATLSVNPPTPPFFSSQPSSRTVEVGEGVQFSIVAGGHPLPAYQWQYQETPTSAWFNVTNGPSFTGANGPALSFTADVARNGYRFRCAAINAAATVYSNEVLLTVLFPVPVITTQPVSQAVLAGAPFQLSVAVNSADPVIYQWRLNGLPIANATSPTYSVAAIQPATEGAYSVVVTNSRSSVISNEASVVIATSPVIATQPQSQELYTSTALTLSVAATSNAPLSYGWQRNGEPIPGATAATYSIPSIQASQAGDYRVVVTTVAGSVTSEVASVVVKPVVAVQITQQPVARSIFVDQPVTFTVAATGDPAPTYRWQYALPSSPTVWREVAGALVATGAATPALTLPGPLLTDTQTRFRCVVANLGGALNSEPALLTVSFVGQTKLATGRFHSVRLDYLANLHTAGLNSSGQLGTGSTANATSPQRITLPGQSVADVSAFAFHSLFLTTSKELWATGSNATGQLGDGTQVTKTTPLKIAGDVAAIAAGFFHTAYVKTDGTLWTVGGNDSGQLGDGTINDRNTPVQVATGVVEVAAGIRQTLFIKTDGTLWGVGNLDGSDNYVSTPVQFATGVKAVAAGGYHSIFLKTDGSVWTVGYNATGQLGDGTNTSRTTPVQIATGARAIVAGYFHSAFIAADHTLWAFGHNGLSQLGDGTTVHASLPRQVASQVATVSASEGYTLFTKLDGSLWATGLNSDGQFGAGTTSVIVPTQIVTGAIFTPAAPVEVTATTIAAPSAVRLTWQGSSQATAYEVWRSATNDRAAATQVAGELRWAFYLDASAGATSAFYWVKAVNSGGASDFSVAVTAGQVAPTPPVIAVPPADATVNVGYSVSFSVTATGDAPLSYQWYRNGDPLPEATTATLAITHANVTDAGNYTVVVTNAAGSVTSAPATLAVNPLAQEIAFAGPLDQAFSVTPFGLSATASSGLPVAFEVVSGLATLVDDQLTLTGVGRVTLRATQAGNATYAAAPAIERSFTVTPAVATVTLGDLSAIYDGSAKAVAATTAPAGLAVTLTYDGGATAPTEAGSYGIAATIDEPNYTGAATGTLVIAKAAQTIVFAAPPDQAFTLTPIALNATATSGLPVSLSVVSGPATISGNTLTLAGAGTITVSAAQPGDANREPAPIVERSFVVSGNYQAWLLERFTADELLDSAISGSSADPDGDGFANLLEYALGYEPRTATTAGLPEVAASASEWTYTYTRPSDRSDVSYAVEVSTNLTAWTTTDVVHELVSTDADAGTQTWRASVPLSSAGSLFFRLQTSLL